MSIATRRIRDWVSGARIAEEPLPSESLKDQSSARLVKLSSATLRANRGTDAHLHVMHVEGGEAGAEEEKSKAADDAASESSADQSSVQQAGLRDVCVDCCCTKYCMMMLILR